MPPSNDETWAAFRLIGSYKHSMKVVHLQEAAENSFARLHVCSSSFPRVPGHHPSRIGFLKGNFLRVQSHFRCCRGSAWGLLFTTTIKMFNRAFASAKQQYDASRAFVKTATEVIDEHKSLIWVAGTASSALAGWAVYTSRRLHYSKIEDAMSEIRKKISEKERDKIPHPQSVSMALVVAPAVGSAFLVGYLCGRTRGSYIRARTLQVRELLKEDKVYVAVLPAHTFDPATVGRRVEAAITEAESELVQQQSKGWRDWRPWGRPAPQRLRAPAAVHTPQHQQHQQHHNTSHHHRQIQQHVQAAIQDQQQQQQEQQQQQQKEQQIEEEKISAMAAAAAAAATAKTSPTHSTAELDGRASSFSSLPSCSTSALSAAGGVAAAPPSRNFGGFSSAVTQSQTSGGSSSSSSSTMAMTTSEFGESAPAAMKPLVCANAPSAGCIAAAAPASCAAAAPACPILSNRAQ
mmetsp:Transcript_50691/g.109499  ORF Transcript_50691/g.109499 Transcript_50691/m.109499 type:complete len:462 (-) Transcript_50691:37-1422(-)